MIPYSRKLLSILLAGSCTLTPIWTSAVPREVRGPSARPNPHFGSRPLYFEPNVGQADPTVRFLARGAQQTLFLTAEEAVLRVSRPAAKDSKESVSAALRFRFDGARNDALLRAQEILDGKSNYFVGRDAGNWRSNVPHYGRVQYEQIYSGIDVAFYGNENKIEYDFLVAPGADPAQIALRITGADRIAQSRDGNLVLHTAAGEVIQQKPFAYQRVNGTRREVASQYRVERGVVRFELDAYDASLPLVIDPVLLYSTFLGGSSPEIAWAIAVDAAGNAYVAGYTDSANFPVSGGTPQVVNAGGRDMFITKLNPTGTGIVYSTYIGGMGTEEARGIAVDSAGNAFVGGYTNSSDFPTTPGAFQTAFGGVDDAVALKLNPAGSALVYSTYLGGNNEDPFGGFAIDSSGNAYVGGSTRSLNFPTTPGSFQPALVGFRDIFVTKLNTTGSGLVYSTYVGGGNFEDMLALTVDGADQVHFTGRTFFSFSPIPYPTTPGAFQSSYDGIRDGIVTKLNAAGSALLYSTLLGGTAFDESDAIAVDSAGNAYVSGWTFSADFPTTPGVVQTTFLGDNDAFVTKLNPSGTGLVFSTLLGGSAATGTEVARGIAVDSSGHAHVVGVTQSTDFPVANAFQPASAGSLDAFIAKLNPTATALVYSSYLGSLFADDSNSVALDALPTPNAYIAGQTGWDSSPNPFPTTPGVVQPALGGGNDGFVAKIGDLVIPPATGKVTGGGTINVAGGTGNFGFIVQRDFTSDPITGELQYHNKAAGAKVKSVAFTSFTVIGNTSTYAGSCTLNGAACTFSVSITDNGEPGANDIFTISINAGPAEGGTIRSGNVKVH